MPLSKYPNGFADGVTIRGMPINIMYPGDVYWLNNSAYLADGGIAGSDGNKGTYQQPFRTLSGALTAMAAVQTPGRGDILMVMPNHAETISSATALTVSMANVAIVGIGNGAVRPTFTLDTANTATINVTANNVSFINCRFIANFLAIANVFTLTTAKDFAVSGCEVKDTSAILNFAGVVKLSTTDNAADGLLIENNRIVSSHASNAYSIVTASGSADNVVIQGNDIRAVTTSAVASIIPIAAGKIVTNLKLVGNNINTKGATGTTTGLLITTNQSTNSGVIANNNIQNLATGTTEILVTASSGYCFFNNYYARSADKSGFLLPAADTA